MDEELTSGEISQFQHDLRFRKICKELGYDHFWIKGNMCIACMFKHELELIQKHLACCNVDSYIRSVQHLPGKHILFAGKDPNGTT